MKNKPRTKVSIGVLPADKFCQSHPNNCAGPLFTATAGPPIWKECPSRQFIELKPSCSRRASDSEANLRRNLAGNCPLNTKTILARSIACLGCTGFQTKISALSSVNESLQLTAFFNILQCNQLENKPHDQNGCKLFARLELIELK